MRASGVRIPCIMLVVLLTILISCVERRVLDAIEMNNPTDITVHPSGDYLYVIQGENTVGIYSIPEHQLIHSLDLALDDSITGLEALPDGQHMLVSQSSQLLVLGR